MNLALVAPWLMSRGPSRGTNGSRFEIPALDIDGFQELVTTFELSK